ASPKCILRIMSSLYLVLRVVLGCVLGLAFFVLCVIGIMTYVPLKWITARVDAIRYNDDYRRRYNDALKGRAGSSFRQDYEMGICVGPRCRADRSDGDRVSRTQDVPRDREDRP